MSQAGSASDRKPGHPVPVALADLTVGLKSVTFADEEDVDGKISSESEQNDEGNQVLESQQGDSHGDVAAAEGSQVCDEVAPSQQADPHAAVAAAEQSQVGTEFAESLQGSPPRFRADEAPSVSSSAIRPAATDSQVEDDISMDTLWSGFSGVADSFIATAQPQADEVQGEDQP